MLEVDRYFELAKRGCGFYINMQRIQDGDSELRPPSGTGYVPTKLNPRKVYAARQEELRELKKDCNRWRKVDLLTIQKNIHSLT